MSAQEEIKRITAPDIRARKGGEPIVALTSYHAHTARLVDRYCDVILVGDSLGMVVLGYESTLQVTVDDVVHHAAAVARAKPRALVVGDMPWLSYHTGVRDAVVNAGRLIAHIDRSWDLRGMLQARLDRGVPGLQERARRTNEIAVDLLGKRRPGTPGSSAAEEPSG